MLGLSATVVRKDGHHPIVYMQCGPVRFRANDKEEAAARPFDHVVVEHLVVLHGGMGIKARRAKQKLLADTADKGIPRLVLATGKYLGEGFDDARLDTLLLAMPVSWRGTIAQYAGRLHRLAAGKREVVIYDFLDDSVPVLKRMFDRRCKGYVAIGYSFRLASHRD